MVDGVSMDAWHRHGSITVRQRVALLRDVALAVHHAHQHGIVHRSLKPANILVDRDHQPRVTDFAISRLAIAERAPKSPVYLSPEQVSGAGEVDHRADLYALGVMLYEVLTNRPPFEGTADEIMTRTVKESVVAPSKITSLKINPVIYRNLENVCLAALAKRPQDRYPDAAAFARDLTRWLKGEEFRAPMPGVRRLPRVVQILVAVVLLAARSRGAVTPSVVARRRTRPARRWPCRRRSSRAPSRSTTRACTSTRSASGRSTTARPSTIPPSRSGARAGVLHLAPLVRRSPGRRRGTYLFDVKSKDHARLVIGEIERYRGRKAASLSIPLEAGDHRFLLEHSHAGPDDTISISWQKPGEPR
jgi:serine/threonine protein kinase